MADFPTTDSAPTPATLATGKASASDADKARADAQTAAAKAIDAQSKADAATKSKEQQDADKAAAEADKARRAAAEKEASLVPTEPMTAVEAKVISPHVTDDMGAGDHLAQKFSNQPANPQIAKPEHADPDLCTVKLTMAKADGLGAPAITMVHPDLVGDYLRAGWDRA